MKHSLETLPGGVRKEKKKNRPTLNNGLVLKWSSSLFVQLCSFSGANVHLITTKEKPLRVALTFKRENNLKQEYVTKDLFVN